MISDKFLNHSNHFNNFMRFTQPQTVLQIENGCRYVLIHVNLLPVAVLVEVVALEPDDDEGHDRLHHAELQRRLWKKKCRK